MHANEKRILLLSENFPPTSGGSGRWFYELYSRLPANNVMILAHPHNNAQSYDQVCPLHIERMDLSCQEWGFRSIRGLKFYLKTVKRLYKIVKQHNIDEIHCGRVIHEGVSAWLLSLFTSVKFVCFVHGEDVETAATSKEHSLMVKQVCKKAQYLICNSHNSANIVKRLEYAGDEKLHILHPGVDAQAFVPVAPDAAFRAKMGWQDKFVILTVGRLQKRKGQDKMIEAMPAILKHHANAVYVMIGDGECRTELEGLINQHGLDNSVHLLSDIDDAILIQCYQQCDLFILPNRTIDNDIEGFGMVLVEAQSCGKPVVAGDSGGTKETLIEGETGWVIDCTEAAPMAEKLVSFIDELLVEEKAQQYQQKARQHVLEHLDWQAHVQSATTLFGLQQHEK